MPAAEPTPSTLDGALEQAGRSEGTGVSFVDRREAIERLSWSEIWSRAVEAGGRLQATGLRPGDRVALILPTSPVFPVAFFGALLAGAVPVPVHPPLRLGRMSEYHQRAATMISRVGARLILTAGHLRRLLGDTVEAVRPELGCRQLADLPAGRRSPEAADPDRLAMIQFSSGTTVDPKPVALTHRAVMAQVELLNGHWPDGDGVRHSGVSWLPLYHDMGLIGCLLAAVERAGDLALIPPEVFLARPAIWLRTISRRGATISPAPNFAYSLCLRRVEDADMKGVDLSSWRVAPNGAEAVAPRVLRDFNRRFAHWGLRPEALTPVYGLAEASLAVTFSDIDRPFVSRRFDREQLAKGRAVANGDGVELASNGPPLAGFELSIRGAGGAELPPGRVGRLWVRGPSLMQGYFDDAEATARTLRDGWLDTGDLGFVREEGLYLTGRSKDILVLRGRNYSPDEVEHAVESAPHGRFSAAAALSYLPEDGEREILHLFVEAPRGLDGGQIGPLEDRCRRAVLARTGLEVDRIALVEPGALPRTSSGKVRRRETLRRFRAGELTSVGEGAAGGGREGSRG